MLTCDLERVAEKNWSRLTTDYAHAITAPTVIPAEMPVENVIVKSSFGCELSTLNRDVDEFQIPPVFRPRLIYLSRYLRGVD
ncbi:unnamed protein product [Acanthocheilonema viteae]|uniref:Uncharacterized protein n=1 Tax=Acanthocheilonema viteae TaxID=6277 RepID=A0A498SUZ0_ACAVI|nr:unnamed protein product [Acanthocheilonema viteae]